MKNRLLFLINVDSALLSHRLPIALAAKNTGYEVHIACCMTKFETKLMSLGFHVHPLTLDRQSTGIISNFKTFVEICRVLHIVKPDILHLVSIKPIILGSIAAKLMRVKKIIVAFSGLGFVYIAEGFVANLRRMFVALIYRFFLSGKNLVAIFQNGDDEHQITKICNLPQIQRKMIKGSGVNLETFSPSILPTDSVVIMFCGRLLIDKGIREFIGAAKIIQLELGRIRFVVAGKIDNGNPMSICQEELDKWVLEGIIEYWGHRDDMQNVLAQSSIVVLPSYREGLPKILIEAAASARPIITTDVPGCRDSIIPNKTGLLVRAKDYASLAAAIKKLIDNPKKCKTMGMAGRKLAEAQFDEKSVIKSHLEIYQNLISKKSVL